MIRKFFLVTDQCTIKRKIMVRQAQLPFTVYG
jgi:hypothetical protein